jgi:cytidylate kinase
MEIAPKIIIAIDGYSSCGKSTMAKELAKAIGYLYIDSGAMYRAVALFCINQHLVQENQVDIERLKKLLPNLFIEFRPNKIGNSDTFLNGINIEEKIRTLEVAHVASQISAIPFVREAMVELQQHLGIAKGVVMDGRDIGTDVFPNSELKIFVTASPEIRAKRRFHEMIAKGITITFEEVLANVKERDERDTHREASPLRKAKEALVLDNSYLSIEEQFTWLLNTYKNTMSNIQCKKDN